MIPPARSIRMRGALLLAVLVGVAGILRAEEFWKRKPSSEWTLKESLKLLQHSPWARQEVRALLQSGAQPEVSIDRSRTHCDPEVMDAAGNCLQTRVRAAADSSPNSLSDFSSTDGIVFLIRWESCAPVEDAFARLSALGERATAEYLSLPPRFPADRYVVTLKALQKSVSVGASAGSMPSDPIGSLDNDASGPRARISVGKVTVTPLESENSGVGASEAAHFYFAREVNGKPLVPLGRVSRVTFEFRGQRFSVKTHFDLDPAALR